MTTTTSGKYVVFDVTEFLPGKLVPQEFCQEAEQGGPWFFMPSSWLPDRGYGGSAVSKFRGYPLIYSVGHVTEAAALQAAEDWEVGDTEREREYQEGAEKFLASFRTVPV